MSTDPHPIWIAHAEPADDPRPGRIVTVRGVGYRLDPGPR